MLDRIDRAPFTFIGMVRGFWISPRAYPDFGWTLLSRILVNIGNALITGLLLYFLIFGLGRPESGAEDDLLIVTLIYMVFSIVASIVGGRLSDRWMRRKPFVFASAALQAAGALLLLTFASFETVMVAAAMLGAGYGCFLAVDQALATQVLPDARTRGKDLGIMNIASAVPQALAPMLGALIVVAFGGFSALFIVAAAIAALGAVTVLPIKAAR